MRSALFVILIVLVTGCVGNDSESEYRPNLNVIIANRLINEISGEVFFQLKQENNQLYLCERGGAGRDQIKLIHWGFDYYKEIDMDEARELAITIGNRLLKAFNEDERIHPYLACYPFQPENIELRIFLHNSDGSELNNEKLHVVSVIEGKLNYKIGFAEGERLKIICTETYDEAMAKLNATAQL